jgi:hypothetical protein
MIEPDFHSPPLTRLCFLKAAVGLGMLVGSMCALVRLFEAREAKINGQER